MNFQCLAVLNISIMMIYLDHLPLGHPADSHFHIIHNIIISSIFAANDFLMQSSLYLSQNNCYKFMPLYLRIKFVLILLWFYSYIFF